MPRPVLLPPSLLLSLLVLAGCHRADAPARGPASAADRAAATRIAADVGFLADDALEGREAGTRGYRLAALYVAQRFRAIGLEPAGERGGYYQAVPLLKATRLRDGARFAFTRDGRTTEFRFAEQYLPAPNFNREADEVTAPAVFVGQAIVAPGLHRDDFAGVDLHGKIAVLFGGAPGALDNDRRAFLGSTREKLRALVEHGAIGAVFVGTPEQEARQPWSRLAQNWSRPAMRLRDPERGVVDGFPQLRAVAHLGAAGADALFAGAPKGAAELFKAAADGTVAAFELPGTVTLANRTRIEPLVSRNVVARLAGGDAKRAAEHVVFSAHLDHLGVGAPVNGDGIYNGALDNALGVATMLEAARQLATATDAPKRSLLFVAVTAEEQGLLGAEWFASHPTVPAASLVADVNLDMPMLLAPSRDVVPIGIEHSSLQQLVEQAAGDAGVALSPDPFPEEVAFVRSDQYAFIRAGIPAVFLDGGVEADGPVRQELDDPKLAQRNFLRNCYHQPCDDTRQPIRYDDAARLARLNAAIGTRIANAAQRPRWNTGDFFGDRFRPAVRRAPPAAGR